MDIKGKVHCFFEQSGTFKREFIKLGIPAEDYDIQNNFGETDHTDDLFAEIEKAYVGGVSLFDNITPDDLIMAFFPCIYFCAASQMHMSFGELNYRKLTTMQKAAKVLERSEQRNRFFSLLVMMYAVTESRGLRMVIENPWSEQTYLKANFVAEPTIIDSNRRMRGDYYTKPTAYWFINCVPTHGKSYQRPKENKTIISSKGADKSGICSEERSLISPDYARNFICDFILGKEQTHSELSLFKELET